MELRLGMDGWEKRHTGGEVERINNLDPVSSGTDGVRESKHTAQTHKIHVHRF